MKKHVLLISALFYSMFNAQGVQNYKLYANNFFPQSPNSTPFAIAGKYPVNMYKGVPIINIPLFSSEEGNNDFGMSLDYNVRSVKPSTIPTWVGLGWNLNVGGSVTRIVNGGVDEVYSSLQTPYNHYSYLDNYSTLDSPTWDSQQALQTYYSNNLQLIMQNEPSVVPSPDEFIINANGLSGMFYLNEKGKWIGRTQEGRTLKIEHQYKFDYVLSEKTLLGAEYIGNKSFNLKRILYGFTVTTDDGTKYIFGLDDKAIEFSSNPETVDQNFNPHIVPSAWNIKEIVDPTGKSIKFTYERDDRAVFVVNRSGNRSYYTQGSNSGSIGNSAASGNLAQLNSNRLNSVFLTKVEGEDYIVNFTRSLSDQKEYVSTEVPTNQWEPPYTHHISAYSQHKHWFKLDGISVTDKAGRLIKNIIFNYNNDPTDRLMLNSVSINGIENYGFQYNAQKLPSYVSDATDHWGFYNGTSFLEAGINLNVPQDQQKSIFQNVYPTYKQPNLNISKAQTLEKITHPTGGTTTFEYELNDYSKYGDKDMNDIYLKINSTASNMETAGGLRIKKIKSCNENNSCINKSYSYLNDDGITSSGVLPYKPIYLIEGSEPSVNLNFWEFNFNSYQSLKSEDNSITYSKVTEIDDNGGKKETYFTNLNQDDYKDKSGNSYFGWLTSALYKQLPYLSFSLMRGKPLKETVYSDTGKISETTYTYTKQTDYLRAYTFLSKQFGSVQTWGNWSDVGGISYGALLDAHNVNFNTSFLAEKKTVFEDVETKDQHFYNYVYNVPTSSWRTESDGNIYVTNYSYASDLGNQAMISAYMVGVPVRTEFKKNTLVTSKNETVYPTSLPTAQSGNLLLPTSELYYDPQTNNPSTEITYDKYDSDGNVLQFTNKNDIPTTVIWGYGKTQPIAKIEGATYDQVSPHIAAIISASENDFITPVGMTPDQTETAMVTALDSFRKNPALAGFQITTYSYDPVIGVRSVTPPSGIREVYKYDSNSRLEKIEDLEGKLLKEFKYNYKQ